MLQHGKGPKDVLVRGYSRWQRGQRRHVGIHVRGNSPKLSLRASRDQLDFGFG